MITLNTGDTLVLNTNRFSDHLVSFRSLSSTDYVANKQLSSETTGVFSLVGTGFDSTIYAIQASTTDNKIYIGGIFTSYNSVASQKLLRMHSYGSKDTSFNIGSTAFNNQVSSICQQSDGKVVIGGAFTTFSGSSNNYLIRLNSTGTKDSSFNIGTGFNNEVVVIKQLASGKFMAGGYFDTFTGSTNNHLIRLNSTGTKDSTFNIGTGFIGNVFDLAEDANNKIVVAGQFTQLTGNTTIKSIVRFNTDGTRDTGFNAGYGAVSPAFNSDIRSIAIQSDGKIIAGGGFTTFTGSTNNHLIRLNSNGTKDSTFNIGTGFNNDIRTIALQSDGKILVGGVFTTYTGSTNSCLIRLNSDGTKDSTFNIGTGFNNLSVVYSVKVQTDGKILVGGNFTGFTGNSTTKKLVRLNSDGTINNPNSVVSLLNTPTGSTSRVVDYISTYNTSTGSSTQSIFLKANNGNSYKLWSGTLNTGEKVEYNKGDGFNVMDRSGAIKYELDGGVNPISFPMSKLVLSSDIVNNDGTANTLRMITGLTVNVTNGNTYFIRYVIPYSSASTNTGSRFTLSGTSTITRLTYVSRYISSNAGAINVNYNLAYGTPAAATTQSVLDGMVATFEIIFKPSSTGTIYPMFSSEVSASAITVKAGSVGYYQQII